MRFFLFREGLERAVLLLVTSRVILDEVSFEPLLSEICELYETRATGREPPPESGLRLAKLTSPDEPPPLSIDESQRVAFWREGSRACRAPSTSRRIGRGRGASTATRTT